MDGYYIEFIIIIFPSNLVLHSTSCFMDMELALPLVTSCYSIFSVVAFA